MKKIRNILFPPFIARYIDPEQCCSAVGDRTAQLLDALRRGIERRRCGQDHRPGLGQRRHVAQVYERQGRFAYDEHQPAPLLEHHVGGPLDQALRRTGGHTPHGTYRRRHDRHAVVTRRAARRRGRTCRRSHIRGCACPRAATLPRAPSPRGRGGCTRARSPTRTARRAAVLSSGGHRWRRWRRLWRLRTSCQNSMALHLSPICRIFSSVRGRA